MAHHAKRNTSNRIVFLVITMSSFVTPFMGSAVNIALPSIGQEFGMDAVLLAWVTTSYLLAGTVFLLPFGRFADIYGRQKIFTYGIIIFTASSVLSALSISAVMLIAFRALQGIGGAMIFGTNVAILTSVFPAQERGKVLGINVAAVYLGLSLGPFLGGLLTQYAGWRSIFWLNLPLGLIIITYFFWKLKGERAEAKGEKFDLIGSLIYGLGIIALIYGLSLLPEISGALLTGIGVVGIMLFIWWETRTTSPILHMDLFRHNRVFAFSNLAVLVSYSATFAVAFLLSLYLQYVKGFSPQNAGLVLVAMPTVQAIFSPYAGQLSDRVSPQLLASAGMALTTIGLGLLVFLNQQTPVEFIVASLIVLGAGFALFSSPNTNAIMSSVENKFYGVASATISTMRQVGMMFSMGISMLIISLYVGRVEITPQYYAAFTMSLKTAFIIFTVLCFGGVFASLARSTAPKILK
ncbi:MAG: MFS transporter [Dehalococcoidales bacterium]|nr:MFS transporter [Dehalococcoidales bacterium]